MALEEARARLQLQGLDPSQIGYGAALNQLENETERRRQDQDTMNQLRVNSIKDQGSFLGGILPSIIQNYRAGKTYARQEAAAEQDYQVKQMEMAQLTDNIEEARAKRKFLGTPAPGSSQSRQEQAWDTELKLKQQELADAALNRQYKQAQIKQATQGIASTTHDQAVVKYRQAINNPQLTAQLDAEYAKQGITPADLQAIKGEAARPDYMALAARQAAQDATPEGQALRDTKTKANTYKTALTQMQEALTQYENNQRLGGAMDTAQARDATKKFADSLRAIGENEQADAVEANFAERMASGDFGKTRSDVMHQALAGTAAKAKADLQASAPAIGQYGQDKQLEQTYDYLDSVANSSAKATKNSISPVTGQPVSYGINTESPWGQNNAPADNGNPFRSQRQYPPANSNAPGSATPPPGAQGGAMIYTGSAPQIPPQMPQYAPGSFRPGANAPKPQMPGGM